MSDDSQEIPIFVTYYKNSSSIFCQKEFGSFAHFGSILNYFEKNLNPANQFQLKETYLLDNRKIDTNDLLMNLLPIPDKSQKIINANLFIEIEDKKNSNEKDDPCNTKLLQPKLNPFGVYVFDPKEGDLSLKQFNDIKMEKEKELNKININTAYCNSNKYLFLSGGTYSNNEIKNFWIINNESFDIQNINMRYSKSEHSMLYIYHKNEEIVFIAGGNDLRTFYYDVKNKIFKDWGKMNYHHNRPALVYIDNYIYCFDTSNKNEITFERTNLNEMRHIWEKINPESENEKLNNLLNKGFGLVTCGLHKIMICGGEITNMNPYLYDIDKNWISEKNKTDDILFTFSDKNFYKINNNIYVALPSSFEEEKEILIFDKNKNTLNKININSKEGKRQLKNLDGKAQKIQDSSFGNINIEINTIDVKISEKKIKNKKDKNNQIMDIDNDINNFDNISYFERKSEKKNHKNKMFEKMNKNNLENTEEENRYIIDNHNYTNSKKEEVRNDFSNNNISNNNGDGFNNNNIDDFVEDDFEDDINYKKSEKIEINLNFNDIDDIYEVEGNNYIYDSNQKNFNDIKSNNEMFNIKNIKRKEKPNYRINKNYINTNVRNNVSENRYKVIKKKVANYSSNTKDENEQKNNLEEINTQKNNIKENKEEKVENLLVNNDNNLTNNNHELDNGEVDEQNNENKNEEEFLKDNEQQNHCDEKNEQDEENEAPEKKEEKEQEQNDDINIEQILDQNNIQNIENNKNENYNEQNNAVYNEEKIKGSTFDEEKQINDEESEKQEEKNENSKEEEKEPVENDKEEKNEEEENELEKEQNNDYIEDENDNNEEAKDQDNNNSEEKGENEEPQEYHELQERDKLQQIISQPLNYDIIQINNNRNLSYYDKNNFCNYEYKQEEIEF